MKKELKKIIINFNDINKKCDSDFKKLSDKCKNYELSHNRKLRLLEKIAKHWDINKTTKLKKDYQIKKHAEEWAKIVIEIEKEINAPLRIKSEPITKKNKNLIVPLVKKPITIKDIFKAARAVEDTRND